MTIPDRRPAEAGARAPSSSGPSAVGPEGSPLYQLTVKGIWRFLTKQPASFWLICAYLFMEYVRPQSIYAAIEGFPLAQVALVLATVAFVLEQKFTRRFNAIDGGMIFFGVVLLASAALAWDPAFAFSGLKVVIIWFLVYYLITNLVDTEGRLLVFMFSFLLYSLKMSQHATRSWVGTGFGFRSWGATGAPGWFHNSGEFAIQMTIFLPLAIYFILALRKYWPWWKTWLMWTLPGTAVIGVLASSSRGGQLGMAAVVVVMAAKSKRKFKALAALFLVAVSAYALMPEEQKERFETAGEDRTSERRLTYWEHGLEIINERPALGIGYDNWLPYYRRYYNPQSGQVPHSIYIEAGAELGYTGLLAFLLLVGLTFYVNHRTRRAVVRCRGDPSFLYYMAHGLDVALVGFLVSGAFVTVLYYPFLWVNLAMTSALYTVARRKVRASRRAERIAVMGRSGETPAAADLRERRGVPERV